MERLPVDGDGEGRLVRVVDPDDCALEPHAASPHALKEKGIVNDVSKGTWWK